MTTRDCKSSLNAVCHICDKYVFKKHQRNITDCKEGFLTKCVLFCVEDFKKIEYEKEGSFKSALPMSQ